MFAGALSRRDSGDREGSPELRDDGQRGKLTPMAMVLGGQPLWSWSGSRCALCRSGGGAPSQGQEGVDDIGVEMAAGLLADVGPHLVGRQRAAVGTIGGQRVPDVGHR